MARNAWYPHTVLYPRIGSLRTRGQRGEAAGVGARAKGLRALALNKPATHPGEVCRTRTELCRSICSLLTSAYISASLQNNAHAHR